MCDDLTRPSEAIGYIFSLCDDYPRHFSDILGFDPTLEGPAPAVLESFDASVAIVEIGYFDLDYRSEFTAINETTFADEDPLTIRVHFFAGNAPRDNTPMRDAVERLKASYLGYVVIRSQVPPTIGRSLIPPAGPCGVLDSVGAREAHVRTAVTEYVELFGVSLTAVGVPFMEQDGRLLRCSHVTAWMAHYSAVLRGIVARRPSAAFNRSEDPRSYGRSFPSSGTSLLTQSQVLRHMDLPPEVIDAQQLLQPRPVHWYSRSGLQDAAANPTSAMAEHRLWLAENLTATVCRYLNSGIPVILDNDIHSVMICGYLREEDIKKDSIRPLQGGQTDVVAFLAHDDQVMPFRVIHVEDILDQALKHLNPRDPDPESVALSLLVPLPRGLWLSGSSAEIAGAKVLSHAVQRRLEDYDARPMGKRGRRDEFERARVLMKALDDAMKSTPAPSGAYTVRTYALNSSDFKQDFARRLKDRRGARSAGYCRMPKYVWVVEILDRSLRQESKPAVVATVVLDASAVSEDGTHRPPPPLFAHLPGQVSVFPWGEDDPYEEAYWFPSRVGPYFSGRWNHSHSQFMSSQHVAARHKSAVAQAGD